MTDGAHPALPPLSEEIRRAGLSAKKGLGQHFLLDPHILDRIVRVAGVAPGDLVYEVGPGPGGLTRALLRAGARVVAVEQDERAIPILDRLAQAFPGQLRPIHGDALAFDPTTLAADSADAAAGVRIVANLPYNVATPLLVSWLAGERWPPWWRSATLMFQQEVAERLVAGPGDAGYGRLALLTQLRSAARIALRLPPGSFVPPPRVESAVVQLVPRPAEAIADVPFPIVRLVQRLGAAAFGQRRKMLRRSLKGIPGALAALERVGIAADRRPETLAVSDFVAVARALRSAPADN